MRFDVRFKGLAHSDFLAQYVEERFSKLEKFEIKPITVHVTFRTEKREKIADVYIQGLNAPFRATGSGENHVIGLDACVRKLWRQMAREKAKVKKHKNPRRSKLGQLEAQIRMVKWDRDAA